MDVYYIMAQVSLYYQTQLETKVSLLPEQINNEMEKHMLTNLKDKIEGKAIDNGIVLKINKLVDHDYGIINNTNFMGTVVYNVKYECFICSPVKNLEITCKVENIVKGYLICRNGPVVVAIQLNNIDTTKFEINNNKVIYLKNKKPLEKGDYLRVSIVGTNINLGEKNIVTMCKLLNIADKQEIKQFEDEQLLFTSGSIDDSKEFI